MESYLKDAAVNGLTTLGKNMATIADALEVPDAEFVSNQIKEFGGDLDAYPPKIRAAILIHQALDIVDQAIEALDES